MRRRRRRRRQDEGTRKDEHEEEEWRRSVGWRKKKEEGGVEEGRSTARKRRRLSDRPSPLHHQGDLGHMGPAAAAKKTPSGVAGAACRNMGTPSGVYKCTHPTQLDVAVIGSLWTTVVIAPLCWSTSMAPVPTPSPSSRVATTLP